MDDYVEWHTTYRENRNDQKTGNNCVSWQRQQSRQQNAKTQSAVIKLPIICLEIKNQRTLISTLILSLVSMLSTSFESLHKARGKNVNLGENLEEFAAQKPCWFCW